MTETYLVMVDADSVKDYIFAPHRLKMVRGGSVVLRDLNHDHLLRELVEGGYGRGNLGQDLRPNITETLAGGEVQWELVYAGGGNVYVLFQDEGAAEKYAGQAQRLFRKRSGTASATCAVVHHGGDFRKTFLHGLALLNRRKTSAMEPRNPVTSPYTKTCEACGREPAAWLPNEPDQEQVVLCIGCEIRRKHSQRSPYLDKISKKLGFVEDLEALVASSRPAGYLALVYLDVDNLGKYFDQLDPFTVESYSHTSRRVQDTVESAVVDACRKIAGPLPQGTTAPFEILLIGGDDALIMLQPQYVYCFLRYFRILFRKHWRNSQKPSSPSGKGLTFSAGIVFAHHHFPIAQFLQHAHDLLMSAKRAGGRHADFLAVTQAMTSGIKARDPKRTMRPYSLKDLLRLWRTIHHWKKMGLPERRVHQLYQAAHAEEVQGTLDYLYLLARLEERHRRMLQGMFRQGLWERMPRRATRGADVAEIWDFVEED